MKKTLILIAVVMMSLPTFAQASKCEGKTTNYQAFLSEVGNYSKTQKGSASRMLLPGGVTFKAEKTTDLASGKSEQAVAIIGGAFKMKMLPGGAAPKANYIDYNDIDAVLKAIQTLKEDSKSTPSIYTNFSYTYKGDLQLGITRVISIKKGNFWVGQVNNAGNQPVALFFDEMTKALTAAKADFANLK